MEHTTETLYRTITKEMKDKKVSVKDLSAFKIYRCYLNDGTEAERIEQLDMAQDVYDKIQEEHIFH